MLDKRKLRALARFTVKESRYAMDCVSSRQDGYVEATDGSMLMRLKAEDQAPGLISADAVKAASKAARAKDEVTFDGQSIKVTSGVVDVASIPNVPPMGTFPPTDIVVNSCTNDEPKDRVVVSAERLMKIAQSAKDCGFEYVTIETRGDENALVVRSEDDDGGEFLAILMPIRMPKD